MKSLFHEVQDIGLKDISLYGGPNNFRTDGGLFDFMMKPTAVQPFPVTMISIDGLRTLSDKFMEDEGLGHLVQKRGPLREYISTTSRRNGVCHALRDMPFPSLAFGVEAHAGGEARGVAFHVIPDPARPKKDDITLGDIKQLRMYMFGRTPTTGPQLWRAMRAIMPNPHEASGFIFSHFDLLEGQVPASQKIVQLADDIEFQAMATLTMLCLLQRDPLLVQKKTEFFGEKNRLRRLRKKSLFSAVTEVTVDAEVGRPVQVQMEKMARDLEAVQSAHKKPGPRGALHLVRRHECKGKWVEGFARCANEVVRREATGLYQADPQLKNPDIVARLAELVAKHGAAAIKAKFSATPLRRVRVAKPKQGPKPD